MKTIRHWKKLQENKEIHMKASKHGSKNPEDVLEITGSTAFVEEVLSNVKSLLNSGKNTKLKVEDIRLADGRKSVKISSEELPRATRVFNFLN